MTLSVDRMTDAAKLSAGTTTFTEAVLNGRKGERAGSVTTDPFVHSLP